MKWIDRLVWIAQILFLVGVLLALICLLFSAKLPTSP